jgi:hypothetical protein
MICETAVVHNEEREKGVVKTYLPVIERNEK